MGSPKHQGNHLIQSFVVGVQKHAKMSRMRPGPLKVNFSLKSSVGNRKRSGSADADDRNPAFSNGGGYCSNRIGFRYQGHGCVVLFA